MGIEEKKGCRMPVIYFWITVGLILTTMVVVLGFLHISFLDLVGG